MSVDTVKELRRKIVGAALWGITNEPRIHYTMGYARDDWLQQQTAALPLWTDCSGFVTLCYWKAGAKDPNGLDYRVLGYTGTLLTACRQILPKQAAVGDLIVYGPNTGHHVTLIIGNEQDGSLIVASHGQEKGPVKILNYKEAASQPKPIRFLRSQEFV